MPKQQMDMPNPVLHPSWEYLNQQAKRRMLLFVKCKFEIGVEEPEEVDIENVNQLQVALSWATFHIRRRGGNVESLISDVLKYNMIRLQEKRDEKTNL